MPLIYARCAANLPYGIEKFESLLIYLREKEKFLQVRGANMDL